MGRGRARVAVAVLAGALTPAAVGCGAETHTNDPRPQAPLRVSVTISPRAITVQPRTIAVGPARTQQIPQNQNHEQPPIDTDRPLTVAIVAANQTRSELQLELRGPRDINSPTIPAGSPATLQTDLPTGTYRITAGGIPDRRPGRLVVGSFRASSENDVLLP